MQELTSIQQRFPHQSSTVIDHGGDRPLLFDDKLPLPTQLSPIISDPSPIEEEIVSAVSMIPSTTSSPSFSSLSSIYPRLSPPNVDNSSLRKYSISPVFNDNIAAAASSIKSASINPSLSHSSLSSHIADNATNLATMILKQMQPKEQQQQQQLLLHHHQQQQLEQQQQNLEQQQQQQQQQQQRCSSWSFDTASFRETLASPPERKHLQLRGGNDVSSSSGNDTSIPLPSLYDDNSKARKEEYDDKDDCSRKQERGEEQEEQENDRKFSSSCDIERKFAREELENENNNCSIFETETEQDRDGAACRGGEWGEGA